MVGGAIADSAPTPEKWSRDRAQTTMSATQKSHPDHRTALLLCHCYITDSSMAIAIAFNVLIYQFLEESLVHTYAVGHDHTRISDHRLTH